MVRIKKIYAVVPVLEVYYEPEDQVRASIDTIPHIAARIYSYSPLVLGSQYVLSRTKLTSRITLTDTTPARALESFKKNYRNEIRKTLTNTRLSFSHIDGFSQEGYELYVAFERSAGRKPMRRRDAKGHWFLAYEDETLRSGVFALDVSPIIKIIAIFSVRNSVNYESSKIVGYLSKRLIYEIVCYGISKSREYVDLAYINLNDPKKAGITAFKMGFLGDETNEYLYEYKLPLLTYFKKLTLKYKLLKSRF